MGLTRKEMAGPAVALCVCIGGMASYAAAGTPDAAEVPPPADAASPAGAGFGGIPVPAGPIILPSEYIVEQLDWAGGPGVNGPVTSWTDRFAASDGHIAYSTAGSFRLTGDAGYHGMNKNLDLEGLTSATIFFSLALSRVDVDPYADLYTATYTSPAPDNKGKTQMWTNAEPRPAFRTPQRIYGSDLGLDTPISLAVGDFKGPGIPALAVLSLGYLRIHYRTAGVWYALAVPDQGFVCADGDVAVADFDKELGKPDMALATDSNNSGALKVYTESTGGNAWTKITVDSTGRYKGVIARDFDADGDDDLAATGPTKTTFWCNGGNGASWTASLNRLSGGTDCIAADFNADGNMDVAVVGEGESGGLNAAIYYHTEPKDEVAFRRVAIPGSNIVATPVEVVTADFNADAIPDLAIAGNNGLHVWYNAGGDQAGGDWQTLAAAGPFRSLAAGDVQGDGSIDLVAARDPGILVWYDFSGSLSPSGYLISSVLDTGGTSTVYGTADWDADENSGKILVFGRSDNSPSMENTPWSACMPLWRGGSIGSGVGVRKGDRYFQYRVELSKGANTSPVFRGFELQLGGFDEKGPAASEVEVTPNPVNGSTRVVLRATISDEGRGGSIVTGAAYSIDEVFSAANPGINLEPTDGKWDTAKENVAIHISPEGLAEAPNHTVYVRGVDARDNWGDAATYEFQTGTVGFFPPEKCYPYPNPVSGDRLEVRYFVAHDSRVNVKVFDVRGRLVAQGDGEGRGFNADNVVAVDLSGLAPDIYIYKAEAVAVTTGEKAVVAKKFVVLR